jgi:hypothetical protein
MSAVVTEAYSGGTLQSRDRVEYDYDDSGLRVRSSESSDADLNGSFETAGETTTYLVDHHNHTGYAQTITEITKDGTGTETKRVVYTFGHDERKRGRSSFLFYGRSPRIDLFDVPANPCWPTIRSGGGWPRVSTWRVNSSPAGWWRTRVARRLLGVR